MSDTVTVTQAHIDNGVRPYTAGPTGSHPIELALVDSLFSLTKAAVSRTAVDLDFYDRRYEHAQLPTEACEFVARFNAGLPVRPFTFVL